MQDIATFFTLSSDVIKKRQKSISSLEIKPAVVSFRIKILAAHLALRRHIFNSLVINLFVPHFKH